MILVVRFGLVVLGVVLLVRITSALLDGQIAYSIGEVAEEQVRTNSIAEAVAIWVAFGTVFVAMIIGGATPRLYVAKPWLWKVLLALIFCGYVVSSVIR